MDSEAGEEAQGTEGGGAVNTAIFWARSTRGLGGGRGTREGDRVGSMWRGCCGHPTVRVAGEGDPTSHPISPVLFLLISLCVSFQVRDRMEITCLDKDPSNTVPTSGTGLESRGF